MSAIRFSCILISYLTQTFSMYVTVPILWMRPAEVSPYKGPVWKNQDLYIHLCTCIWREEMEGLASLPREPSVGGWLKLPGFSLCLPPGQQPACVDFHCGHWRDVCGISRCFISLESGHRGSRGATRTEDSCLLCWAHLLAFSVLL